MQFSKIAEEAVARVSHDGLSKLNSVGYVEVDVVLGDLVTGRLIVRPCQTEVCHGIAVETGQEPPE